MRIPIGSDDARSVWIGDVLIRAAAEGTDTFELNRNLVLTDGARADSVPNLEIETGEIEGAGHASATGRFDDEQLFYLQARGIPEDEARRLVVSGFFNDIIGKIGVPEVAEHLHGVIEQKLARTAALARGDVVCSERQFRARLRARRRTGRRRDRGRGRRCRGRGREERRRRSSRSATSARTPRSRCPRATSASSEIECWLHGSRFDLRTGKPTGLPAYDPVPVYPVTLDGDDVLVDVKNPLNRARIPDHQTEIEEPHGHTGDPRPARVGRHRARPEARSCAAST